MIVIRIVVWIPFPYCFAKVVDFLFSDCLGVHDIQTVQIDNLLHVIVLIDLIENLPSNVIIDLLKHLLELVVGDSVLFIRTVLAVVILAICFLLQLSADLLVLLHHIVALFFKIWGLNGCTHRRVLRARRGIHELDLEA